ncbi:MAG: hypothetical protein RSB59_00125 [Clostridia bacterium]
MEFAYYYNKLNEVDKAIYRDFNKQVEAKKLVFAVHYNVKINDALKIYYYLLCDKPTLYSAPVSAVAFLDPNYTHRDSYPNGSGRMEYLYSDEECAKADASFFELSEKLSKNTRGMSTYKKALYAAKLILEKCKFKLSSEIRYQSAASVVLEKSSVCAGLSKAYKILLDSIGVECIVITGEAVDSVVERGRMAGNQNSYINDDYVGCEEFFVPENKQVLYFPHAWNMVNFDGSWLYVDLTQIANINDATRFSALKYFAVNDTAMQKYRWNRSLTPEAKK